MPDKPYSKALDVVLGEAKVKGEKEGFSFAVKSYDGGEPRLEITRGYKDKEGNWRKDSKTKFPRMSIRCIRWIIENHSMIDTAYSKWKSREDERSSSGKDDSF